MSAVKIFIAEDELIIAEDIRGMLNDMGHTVTGIAVDIKEAEEILSHEMPDIALIDIHLKGVDDGIDLASIIRKKMDIPVIFITSYSDAKTVERAKHVMPDGYIVKPFEKADLFTAIEIALFNYEKRHTAEIAHDDSISVVIRDSIFIRKDYMLIKIKFDDLIWIKSELNYLELHCKEARHLIRSTIKEFKEKLPPELFLQIHKSYCINTKYITAIDHNQVWLGINKIPIGRAYLDQIRSSLKLDL
ncbi:MAG TPA: response regulator [Bacteroidales bacterium]|nr:response regulator [Bacteroidales bacterium]